MKTLVLLALLVPSIAIADPEFHINGGTEIAGGDGALAAGGRIHVGIGQSFGSGSVRPQIVAGVIAGGTELFVDDPRALSGSLSLGVATVGGELQLGMKFANGGSVDSRIFASFAVMKVSLDDRLMYDYVPSVSNSGNAGLRAAIGANWADHVLDGDMTCSKKGDDCGLLMLFLPQQAEVVWERDAGSSRYGVALSWGI